MNLGLGLGLGFGGVSAPAVWTPQKIAGALLWLRADLGVTLVAGGVSAWADQSGAGDTNRNALQSSAPARPTHTASDASYNHQATLLFVAASTQFLQTGVWSVAPSQPYSVFIVGNDDAGTNETYTDDLALNHAAVDIIFSHYSMRAGLLASSGIAPTGAPLFLGAVFETTTSSMYVNSSTPVTGLSCGIDAPTGLTIGCGGDGVSDPLNGKIAEVIVAQGAISAGDLAKLVAYVNARYGFTIV
jgi:hypothetical protein